jgi:hypothetical protein
MERKMNDREIFAVYFASIAAIQYHPRQLEKKKGTMLTITQCANIAENMLRVTQERFLEDGSRIKLEE